MDAEIESGIASLPDALIVSRSQKLIRRIPNALTEFKKHCQGLRPWQDATYLLRFLLSESRDEKKSRDREWDELWPLALKRLQDTEEWRAGKGQCWVEWGYKDMDEMYTTYRTPPDIESRIGEWFPQRFWGRSRQGVPVHWELLPTSYHPDLIRHMTIRRLLNNEHTLRHRIPKVNRGRLHDPILGCIWIIDARRLSLFYSSSIYKTATAMIQASNAITSAHYPEQGYRAEVINLGVVLGSMYNLAIKVMPATTQRSTRCHISNDVLNEIVETVPEIYSNKKVLQFTPSELEKEAEDDPPFTRLVES